MTSESGTFGHAEMVLNTLKASDTFLGLRAPVDVEVIPNFSGHPERIEAWLIFGTHHDSSWAEDNASALRDRAISRLRDAGFPEEAVPSFALRFTSVAEIERRGGRFAFFR
jgi:hypothetical protein